MANNKNTTPANNEHEMDDLFRMLDNLEGHSLGEDIEETIRQFGYGDAPSSAFVPPEKGFNPDIPQSDLDHLLIDPDVSETVAGNEALQQLAQLLESNTEEDMVEDMPPPPEERRNPLWVLRDFFVNNLPNKEDTPSARVRKYSFWVSLVALVAALTFLIVDIGIQPQMNIQLNNELVELYQPEKNTVVTDSTEYPQGMLASFKELYKRNNEISGWLSFHSVGRTDFLKIEYPVMYSGDNTKYARVDFDQKKNKNGCLFLDSRNHITGYAAMDQSTIIYGHNMASGQMFAGLNKFIGNENNARTATTLTFSSLYRRDDYVVFAVCLSDEAESGSATYFNYWRTTFDDGAQFLSFVQQVRDRSLFDYPTDVRDDDSIIMLASCTNRSSAHLSNGRVLVFARRMRPGEGNINTSAIVKNMDVIMPYNWYINQKMEPHTYYVDGISPSESMTGTVGSTGGMGTTNTTDSIDPSGTDTTDMTGIDATETQNGTTASTMGIFIPGITGMPAVGPAPVRTTPAPVGTTAPVGGTTAPTAGVKPPVGSTTPSKGSSTLAPNSSATAPNNSTTPPAGNSTTPTNSTTPPTGNTPAPTPPTAAPTEPTAAPTEPTPAPTEPTPAPTEPTPAPTEPTPAPTEPTPAPTEPTDAPTEPTDAPAEPTSDNDQSTADTDPAVNVTTPEE